MLKKIVAACAGVLIGGSALFAGEFDGTFVGKNDGESLKVVIHNEGDRVTGSIGYDGEDRPIEGQVGKDGIISGVWHAPDGMNVPFAASVHVKSIRIRMDGETSQIPRQAGEVQDERPVPQPDERPVPQPDPRPLPQPDQRRVPVRVERENADRPAAGGDIVKADHIEMVRGDIFAVPVPPGWTHCESINETYVRSADLSTGIGFVGLERIQPKTPTQFLEYITTLYKVKNFRLLTRKEIPVDLGKMEEMTYSSTDADGKEVKSWARVVTADVYGSGAGYVWTGTTYADRFNALADDLRAMALKIQIVNEGAAFNRGQDMINLRNRNLNHPLDASFTDSYWKRQLSQEDAAKRDSEVRRGSFLMLDPETGDKYWVGPSAFRSDGTVPNPARPTENLAPPRYWKGHSLNG